MKKIILALFVLANFLFVGCKVNKAASENPQPKEIEFLEPQKYDCQLFEEIRTRTNDNLRAYVVIDVSLRYNKGDEITSAEIIEQSETIRNFLVNYISERTAEELSDENIQIEIRKIINNNILKKGKIKIVHFDRLNIVNRK